MHTPALFADILIIFLASVPVAFLCLRMKLPLVVGLMLTGIAIGPYGLGLITDVAGVEILAEIGIMLLLFTIGLEFSLKRLREMKRLVLLGGGLQIILTITVIAALAAVIGRQLTQAVFFGFLVALSSTAIVLKSYVDRNEIDAPHGRVGIGILLFQDICVVPMLLLIPLLSGEDVVTLASIIIKIGTSVGLLALVVFGAWLLVPLFLKQVVRLRSAEVFLLTIVLLSLGLAWVTAELGLSLAMGAFIAGVVLADSDFSHQATAEILPFRDIFNSLFFVSIGMLLSLGVLGKHIGFVALLAIGLIGGKALIVWGVVRLLGYPQRISAMAALGLAQIGEFSFVLAKSGRSVGLLPDGDYQSFLAASIISMIATPFLIAFAPRFGMYVQSVLRDGRSHKVDNCEADDIDLTSSGGLQNHVVIVGYGLNGRNLARVLRSVDVAYVVLELNAEVVKRAKLEGEKINFGDSTRREVLRHAQIERAAALVLAMSDPQAARLTVKQSRRLNENLHIIVRTRYVSEINELFELGADEVIPEEFETSIEIFSRVLTRYGFARNVIESQIEAIRRQGYQFLRSSSTPPSGTMTINVALDATSTETVKLGPQSLVVGKNLGELDLRGKTGATIIAVLHNGETKISPGARYRLCADDTVVLLGARDAIEKAISILTGEDHPSEVVIGGFNA